MSDEASSARRLPLWLIASILVNVLLIGLIAGHQLGSKPGRGGSDGPGGPGGPPEMRMAGAIVESAAPEDRAAIRRAFAQALRQSRPLREARDVARRAVGEAISAEPYDAAAVDAAFAELRAADDALRAGVQSVLAVQLGEVSAEQRAALAETLTRPPRERRRLRRGDRPPPPPRD